LSPAPSPSSPFPVEVGDATEDFAEEEVEGEDEEFRLPPSLSLPFPIGVEDAIGDFAEEEAEAESEEL
jgi:hypothetical protein